MERKYEYQRNNVLEFGRIQKFARKEPKRSEYFSSSSKDKERLLKN